MLFKWTEKHKLFNKYQATLDKFTEHLVIPFEEKYQQGLLDDVKEDNFLDDLYTIRDTMTFEEVKGAIEAFIFAVHDTTGKTIAAALLLLAMNPEKQEKVLEEIKSFANFEDDDIDDENLNRMEYLDQVIKEAMRLFPVGLAFARIATGDLELSNFNQLQIAIN